MNNTITNLPGPADKIVTAFVDAITAIAPDFIFGVYLTGSLPLQDFHPTKSDIDFLVFCHKLPDTQIASRLNAIHKIIQHQYPKPDLSGSYLALDSLQTSDPEKIDVLTYHEKTIRYQSFDMALVSLTELKYNAITVYGPAASTLPIHVDVADLKRFLHHNINSYWKAWIAPHPLFLSRKLVLLFLFPRLTEWVVLGIARQFYTLQTGKIGSKTQAGLYSLTQVPVQFHAIIEEAIKIRADNRTYPFVGSYGISPSFKRMTRTVDCAQYFIKVFNESYANRP